MSGSIPAIKSTNFIRNHINNDLDSGLYSSIQTRFPPEPNGYLHIESTFFRMFVLSWVVNV